MGSSNLLGITVQYSMDGLKVGEDVVSDVRRKTRKLRRQDGVCRVSGLFREAMTASRRGGASLDSSDCPLSHLCSDTSACTS